MSNDKKPNPLDSLNTTGISNRSNILSGAGSRNLEKNEPSETIDIPSEKATIEQRAEMVKGSRRTVEIRAKGDYEGLKPFNLSDVREKVPKEFQVPEKATLVIYEYLRDEYKRLASELDVDLFDLTNHILLKFLQRNHDDIQICHNQAVKENPIKNIKKLGD